MSAHLTQYLNEEITEWIFMCYALSTYQQSEQCNMHIVVIEAKFCNDNTSKKVHMLCLLYHKWNEELSLLRVLQCEQNYLDLKYHCCHSEHLVLYTTMK